jgi:hypothetical protein
MCLPTYWFVYLGIFGLILLLSAPTPSAYRAEQRAQRAARRQAWATERTARQAWRRRVFGSHPHLYWSLAWFGVPVFSCLMAILMGW